MVICAPPSGTRLAQAFQGTEAGLSELPATTSPKKSPFPRHSQEKALTWQAHYAELCFPSEGGVTDLAGKSLHGSLILCASDPPFHHTASIPAAQKASIKGAALPPPPKSCSLCCCWGWELLNFADLLGPESEHTLWSQQGWCCAQEIGPCGGPCGCHGTLIPSSFLIYVTGSVTKVVYESKVS